MQYNLQKLDHRHSYHQSFKYYLGFARNPGFKRSGPVDFYRAQQWLTDTYGLGVEARHYNQIKHYSAEHPEEQLNDLIQAPWAWSNAYDQLRLYIASDSELAFFQLTHGYGNE